MTAPSRDAITPFASIPIDPRVTSLPKADLHLHQELFPRLDRLVARREGRAPYDWRAWAQRVMDEVPAGAGRLASIYRPDAALGCPPADLLAFTRNAVAAGFTTADRRAALLSEMDAWAAS